MTTYILAFGILGLVILGMSVGVIFGRSPIKGSCGGMSALGIDTECEICGGDTAKCEQEQEKNAKAEQKNLAYDATKTESK